MTPERLTEIRQKVTKLSDDPVCMTKAERISNALTFTSEVMLVEVLDEVDRLQGFVAKLAKAETRATQAEKERDQCQTEARASKAAVKSLQIELDDLQGWPDGRCSFCGEPKEIHDGNPAGQSYCQKVPPVPRNAGALTEAMLVAKAQRERAEAVEVVVVSLQAAAKAAKKELAKAQRQVESQKKKVEERNAEVKELQFLVKVYKDADIGRTAALDVEDDQDTSENGRPDMDLNG